MSPRQFATLIVVLSVPFILWIVMNEAKNNVLSLTKTLSNQIRMNGESLFEPFLLKYRLPEGDIDRQEPVLSGTYKALGEIQTEKAEYGARDRIKIEDGSEHNHRQVVLVGKNREGAPMTVKVEWVQLLDKWYIHGYSKE